MKHVKKEREEEEEGRKEGRGVHISTKVISVSGEGEEKERERQACYSNTRLLNNKRTSQDTEPSGWDFMWTLNKSAKLATHKTV